MFGNSVNPGLLPRSLKALLDIRARVLRGVEENNRIMALKENSDKPNQNENTNDGLFTINGDKILEFRIFVEAYEIYNDELNDLLKKEKTVASLSKQKLQIKEKDNQRIFIKGILAPLFVLRLTPL